MKTKNKLSILILFITLTSSCQSTKNIHVNTIENNLIDFLIKKGDILTHQVNDFKNKKYSIHVTGVMNGYSEEKLLNGIYHFSSGFTHTRVYYLIVEDDKHIILDLSTRESLDASIKITLDFCERQKYCSNITAEYISKLIGVYYVINKNSGLRMDVNCENDIIQKKDLP